MPRILKFICVFCFAFFSFFAAPIVSAQNSELDEIRAIADYSTEMQSYMIEMTSHFEDPVLVGVMDTILYEDEFDSNETMAQFRLWRQQTNQKLADLESRLNNRSKPPNLSELDQLSDALETMDQSIIGLFQKSQLAVNQTETFLQRAIQGDTEGLDNIRAIQVESLQELIKTESLISESTSKALPDNHPQAYFLNGVVLSNDFVVVELDIKLDVFENKTALSDRQDYIKSMQTIQKKYQKAIDKGRVSAKFYLREMSKGIKQAKTEDDKKIAQMGEMMMQIYPRIFDNEQSIHDINAQILDLLKSTEDFADIESAIDDLSASFAELVDVRISLDQEKMRIAQNLQ